MPVFFYIDPEFLNDPNVRNVETITLNYTFFSKLSLRSISTLILILVHYTNEASHD